MLRLILILLCLTLFLKANTYSENLKKYNEAKKNYAAIIEINNKEKELKYLNQLVYYGTKLKKSVYKYKTEIKRLNKNYIKIPKIAEIKKIPKVKKITISQQSKYSIKSVVQVKNKIIIKFNKKVSKKDIKYFIKKGKRNLQYIFDINGRFKDANPTKLMMNNIDRIKVVQYRFNTLRISFIDKNKIKLVYNISNKTVTITVKEYHKETIDNKVQYTTIKQKTIVIDSGHGGKDSGAVGPRRRYEKVVTLNIGKYLFQILRQNGYKVYLTRNKDKYVKLKYRTNLANKKNADMFISIHANAVHKSKRYKTQGVETYFLSPARSARAKRVAALENKGDMGAMNWSSQNTFLTVLNQAKITASNKMAIDIQKNMLYTLRKKYGKNTIKDGGVREGPFWIFVGAQMPSVLVEVGYISHPKESRRIYTKTYQKLISKAIANGIDSYFLKN